MEVDGLAKRIEQLRVEGGKLKDEEEALWKRFFEIGDDIAGENENYRVVVPEIERVIAREMHSSTAVILVDSLKEALTDKQWLAVTIQTRELDMNKLEIAIGKGIVSSDVVNECTEYKDPIAHKKFKVASKKDMKEASEE